MRTTVVYCSQTGYTEQYAEWLGEALGVSPVPFADRTHAEPERADAIVFLSWFHAGGLKGAKWLRSLMDAHPDKHFVVVGVGAYPMPSEDWPQSETDAAFERAFPHERYPHLACFYCQGGFEMERLGLPDKLAMHAYFRVMEKEAANDPRNAFALKAMKQGFDGTNRAYLEPVIEHLKALSETTTR